MADTLAAPDRGAVVITAPDPDAATEVRARLAHAHDLARPACATIRPPMPARVRVEALDRRGTPTAPTFDVALGADTPYRRIAGLGAAPAFGGATGQFYRITASAGMIGFGALAIAAFAGGLPRVWAYLAIAAGVAYVAVQPLLGVWARATLRPGRLERRDAEAGSPLGSVLTCHRHVMALAAGFGRIGDAAALRGELHRLVWEAVAVDLAGDEAAAEGVADDCAAVAAALEAMITGRTPALQRAAVRAVAATSRRRSASSAGGLGAAAAAQARALGRAARANVTAFEAAHETATDPGD